MKLKIETGKLQEMTARAIKGASNNRMIPITSLLSVKWEEGKLSLTTTDASNILKVTHEVEGEPFEVTVQADIFSKLVAKTTSENMTLTVKDSSLEVKGNGNYSIELPLDEEGDPIKFPDFKFNSKTEKHKIDNNSLQSILSTNRAALADTMEIPVLTGYYFGDEIITTDSFKVCSNNTKLFEKDILLSAAMVDLLEVFEEGGITVQLDDNKLLFTSKDLVLYGTTFPGIEDFPKEAIKAYLETEFKKSCFISRSKLLEILDRLALFVSEYDQNGIYLTFTEKDILITSKKSNGVESLPYAKPLEKDPDNFMIFIDIELLRSQVTAHGTEQLELWYGHDTAIKLTSDKITQIIALLEDEEEA